MSTWIWVTLLAALSQSLRTAQQKNLTPKLGEFGASYVRFSYAIPFAWAFLLFSAYFTRSTLPNLNWIFVIWVSLAGVLQIIFTVLLIKLFSLRNFAAGTAFSKTEVIQVAFFEALIVGTVVSQQVAVAIIVGFVAIIMLTTAKSKITFTNLMRLALTKQALFGIGSGAFLALCSVAFRVATDSLEGPTLVVKAGTTLAVSVVIQATVMGLWMLLYRRTELQKSFLEWRSASVVGFFGATTSFCWFYAFSANSVAPVRAVGQIELILAILISFFFFKEKPTNKELTAILLLLLSIIMVLLD